MICYKFGRTPAVKALMVDQRNDVFSNSASLLFSGLAGRLRESNFSLLLLFSVTGLCMDVVEGACLIALRPTTRRGERGAGNIDPDLDVTEPHEVSLSWAW